MNIITSNRGLGLGQKSGDHPRLMEEMSLFQNTFTLWAYGYFDDKQESILKELEI